ncbi:unnamed protein product, partial [Ectocarpus sp. 12 AP-2014]
LDGVPRWRGPTAPPPPLRRRSPSTPTSRTSVRHSPPTSVPKATSSRTRARCTFGRVSLTSRSEGWMPHSSGKWNTNPWQRLLAPETTFSRSIFHRRCPWRLPPPGAATSRPLG